MTGADFAYFAWRRQARPYETPPGLRWEGSRLVGTPRLAGAYLMRLPDTTLEFTITVVRPSLSAGSGT